MIKISEGRRIKMRRQSTVSAISYLFLLVTGVLLTATDARSQTPSPGIEADKIMVIGFVGGLNHSDDANQGVVQINNRLRSMNCAELQVHTLRHFHWRRAYRDIVQASDADHNGRVTDAERQQIPKLILVGHSLGGWAVIKLAKRLEKAHIPVELTVQIDTVGLGDAVVPDNVKSAMNFYQRSQWPIRGENRIRAEDENATRILGNVLIQNVRHEALARQAQISDFITATVRAYCQNRNLSSQGVYAGLEN
jgi:pimeloyl-ACP methyl ester carboxylesterase